MRSSSSIYFCALLNSLHIDHYLLYFIFEFVTAAERPTAPNWTPSSRRRVHATQQRSRPRRAAVRATVCANSTSRTCRSTARVIFCAITFRNSASSRTFASCRMAAVSTGAKSMMATRSSRLVRSFVSGLFLFRLPVLLIRTSLHSFITDSFVRSAVHALPFVRCCFVFLFVVFRG